MEDTRAKTRSSRHGPRVFYTALTMMPFNLWIVIDALHRLACAAQGQEPAIQMRSADRDAALSAVRARAAGLIRQDGPGRAGTLRAAAARFMPAPPSGWRRCAPAGSGCARNGTGRSGLSDAAVLPVSAGSRSETVRPPGELLG